jgi:hypothetical protein
MEALQLNHQDRGHDKKHHGYNCRDKRLALSSTAPPFAIE